MKVALVILLNAVLLTAAFWWLRAEYRRAPPALRRWLLPALAWRVLLTAISGSFPGPDARRLGFWGRGLTSELLARPAAMWSLLQGNQVRAGGQEITRYVYSSNLFFIKLLALLNLASLDNVLLNSCYLSLACFAGCWLLVRTWVRVFPATPPGAAVVALLFWPSVVWWTAGIGKETVLIGSEAALVALTLGLLYGPAPGLPPHKTSWLPVVGKLLAGVFCAWMAIRTRFFFGLPLLGILMVVAIVRRATQRGWLAAGWLVQAGSIIVLLVAGAAAALALGGERLGLSYLSHEVNAAYQHGLLTSSGPARPHLVYPDWQPTPGGMLRHAPLAAGQVLVRPWLGESAQPLYVGVGIENVLLLSVFAMAVVALLRGRAGRLPPALVVALAVYCLLLAAFIGLTTPNLGTLHRYRAALLPWLLVLLLQNDYARALLRRLGLGGG